MRRQAEPAVWMPDAERHGVSYLVTGLFEGLDFPDGLIFLADRRRVATASQLLTVSRSYEPPSGQNSLVASLSTFDPKRISRALESY
jgi:hypothetical protein